MKKIEWHGKIKDNKLQLIKRHKLDTALKIFNENDNIKITFEKLSKKRSNMQNSYYWGVVIDIIKSGLIEVGYKNITADKTHDLLKLKYLKSEIANELTGEVINTLGTTTSLTTSDFAEYIDNCKDFAMEYLNIYIPDPNEQFNIF